jgi:ferric-dicitrate binding protein FerR (iron transport regulator)
MEELLNPYFAAELSDKEKVDLLRKVEGDENLKKEFAVLQNAMALSGMAPGANDKPYADAKLKELMQRTKKRSALRIPMPVLKYAAVAVLVSCIWGLAYWLSPRSADGVETYTTISAPKGQAVHLTLADGTDAWLSSRSKLLIPNSFNHKERTVELDGDGFFSVSKNEKMPFTVKTKQYNIEVTGTQFNVSAYSERPSYFKTDLMEGSVSVYDKNDKNTIIRLKPDETVYLKDGSLIKSHYIATYLQYIKDGLYGFENEPFNRIADRLELWYGVKIYITTPEIATFEFTGKFRQSDSVELILGAITGTGKFNFKFRSETEIDIY